MVVRGHCVRFEQLLRSVDPNISGPEVDRLWKFADKNSDGSLSQAEFEALFATRASPRPGTSAGAAVAKPTGPETEREILLGRVARAAQGHNLEETLKRYDTMRSGRLNRANFATAVTPRRIRHHKSVLLWRVDTLYKIK